MKTDGYRRGIWAARCILTVLLAGCMLGVWPGYLVHDDYVSRTISDRSEAADVPAPRSAVTQYFVPRQGHMARMEFAVLFDEEKAGDSAVRFALCEESGREIFSREILLEQMESGMYYGIRIDRPLKAGGTYSWTLVSPDAEDIGFQVMYTNHLDDQAPENTLFLLGEEQYGEIAQTVSQYTYRTHPDKIIILGKYWLGAVLAYIVCMDMVNRLAEAGRKKD